MNHSSESPSSAWIASSAAGPRDDASTTRTPCRRAAATAATVDGAMRASGVRTVPSTSRATRSTAVRWSPPATSRPPGNELVDPGELVGPEGEVAQGAEVVLQLPDAARADDRRGDPVVAEHPGEGHLRERLAAVGGELAELLQPAEQVVGQRLRRQEHPLIGAGS